MIQSTSSSDRLIQPDAVAVAATRTGPAPSPRPDQLSLPHRQQLDRALGQHPEIRPEMLERARTLASDPDYPSIGILRQVGAQILASPDLSEETA
ncbi:MAG TPA: hypothetical protein VG710_17385 [Opitutus sp.]|nr:hypothetical protein [Opitutus sp.]